MINAYLKLDNPAWFALIETHAHFCVGDGFAKRYQSNIVSFAAQNAGNVLLADELLLLIEDNESVFVIGEVPLQPGGFIIENTLPCSQMICSSSITLPTTCEIELLSEQNDEEMGELINLVQPGYYNKGTRLMGDYFGIRQNGRLVAITGERMRMFGLTEISAVVTHPEFTGRKFAQQLIAHVVNKNLSAGVTPFLHVSEANERAIGIYEMLGFEKRRTINFTKIRRKPKLP